MSVSTVATMLALAFCVSSAAQTAVPPRAPVSPLRGETAPQPPTGLEVPLTPPRTKYPYGKLFDPFRPSPRPLVAGSEPARKTVCGLTIWNVTPDADPRMVLRPQNDRADHKIKRIAPPVCAE